ncbi:pseudouridine synthase [Mucor mucedo]|uniref:pseudouridine synthase n=1 Tax=Mucor mucedo TaxID=29922 RepID=UPI00221EE06C|nr:pseudouridine synthase [Mucor mucedo]KAI7874618.1 pseudouridine synthase [Mucor mucedo]
MICQDEHLVENLNRVLPNHIRIWGYVETQRTFHAKTKCDSRVYEYLLPSYTLNAFERKEWTLEPSSDKDYMTRTEHGAVTKYIAPTDPQVLKAYRVDTPSFDKFKQAMELFQGTHNFHNYTIAKPFADPSCKRFMMDISVNEPMMIEGMEWISVKLHGQSFMLHQIRKMITMAMYSVRTNTPLSFLETTFDATKINIPKAPALGLLLDRPVFGLYNERIKDIPNRSCIDFSLYADAITQFKKQYIYKQIFAQEMAEQTLFLTCTFSFSLPLSLYINTHFFFIKMSTQSIDELVHAIANIAHVEQPCLENLLTIKKLEIAKEPIDKEYMDAVKKCGLQAEKDHAASGLKKATDLVAESTLKVQSEKDKIHEVEVQNEKYAIEYRTLQKYREDLDDLFNGMDALAGQIIMKSDLQELKDESTDLFEKIQILEKVKELIKEADMALLEAILELRASTAKEKSMGAGKVYFPETAFECLQEARRLYPDLPGFKSPTEYVKEQDNTGAYYSPMQKYLWDVRKRLGELITWCADEALVLLERETQVQVRLGQKTDEYNYERRRILKESS